MDFFEKAHVVKKDLSKKESKSEELVKKQLKEMLYGYKNSDRKLIKRCEDTFDANKFNEDSSSVSGFSDLNITNSSNEVETNETLGSDDETSIANTSEDVNISSISNVESVNTAESLSDYDDQIQTVSNDVSQELNLDFNSDGSKSISLNSSDIASEDGTNDSDFDADGELAMKIIENMDKKVNIKKTVIKRKLEPIKQEQIEKPNVELKSNIKESKRNKKRIKRKPSKDLFVKNSANDESSESNSSVSDSNSSTFISIMATEMPNQSLSEILGEYKHPTIRNCPSDIQNISTNNSGMFSTEEVTLEDIQIQEDVGSLTTEYDDNETLDDLNSIDMDTNMEPINDSTSAYDNTLQSEETFERDDSSEILNTFASSVSVYFGENSCIFVLKHPAEIFIHGKVNINALGGTIEVLGYKLPNKPCEVYAPNYNCAHSVKTLEIENSYMGLFSKLTSEGLKVSEAEEIVTGLSDYDGIISLRKLNSYKMDFVENNMSATDLFSKPSKNVDDCFKKASDILKCSIYLSRPWKSFEEVASWRNVVEYGLNKRSRGIVCGGKGVGKSTFLRYCVNKLLSLGPVLVIDLDPGQAEFTVAGNISATIVDKPLLGPSFTHLKTPLMMLNLGMISTMDNPRLYASAVGALMDYCKNNEQLQSMPWIINTMGMSNAMGLKFMTLTILCAQPTYLLQIDSKNQLKGFEIYLDCYAVRKKYEEDYKKDPVFRNIECSTDFSYAFFVVYHSDNPAKNNFSLPPRDERYLNFLAYFGDLMTSQRNGLLGVVPYEVNLEELYIGLNVKVAEDTVTKVINGKIIALCQLTTGDNVSKVFTMTDKPLLCHGHGLIRGVDMERRMVYIITPMAVDKLSQVNTLVYADWVPELRGQERQLPDGMSVPYRTATTHKKRQLMFAPRRRFNPLQLLKMSRNS